MPTPAHPAVSPLTGKILLAETRQNHVGFAFGFRQPCLGYAVLASAIDPGVLAAADRLLAAQTDTPYSPEGKPGLGAVAGRLVHWLRVLLEKSAHPVFQDASVNVRPEADGEWILVHQPCLYPEAADQVLQFILRLFNVSLAGRLTDEASATHRSALDRLMRDLSKTGLQGFNPLHFLLAANELGIPWISLGGNLFQLGYGARARWIDSSFTDATSTLGAQLARDKVRAAALLRRGGVPVPEHRLADDAEDAVRCAERLGYPVVVKPADRDGGQGVKAHVLDADGVRKAYAAAASVSQRILVEQHITGRDYRIQVVCGEIQGILERVPGGVTGNGRDNVRTLLEIQNEERRTATDDRRHLHAMAFDDEAVEQLAAQGLDGDSVPAEGRFVRLRGASNVASGGIPVPVPLQRAHPDNRALAIRAARLLRLDVAGIDLLIPEIATSWLESGGAICEVNAQPQMFTTMHKPMLQSLMHGHDGRIPVVLLIAGDAAAAAVGRDLQQALLATGLQTGLTLGEQVWVGERRIQRLASGSLAGGRMLCHDPAVEAMVLAVSDDQVLRSGWPVDHCDVVLLCPSQSGNARLFSALVSAAGYLSPRRVVVSDDSETSHALAQTVFGKTTVIDRLSAGLARQELAGHVVRCLLADVSPLGLAHEC